MLRMITAIALLLAVLPCASAQQPMHLPVDKAPLIIYTDSGHVQFDVEVASTPEQKARGLMYRRDFPAARAMLFIFPYEQRVMMWMANTPLPLDMIFANSSGQILYIYTDARPFSKSIISSIYPVSYVIETNAGQLKAKGIAVGQRITHPAIGGNNSQ